MKKNLALLSIFLLVSCLLTARVPLSIHQQMQTFFEEHLTQKHMTEELMQEACLLYIQQFDPECVYLLESEVKPFQKMSKQELELCVFQYEREEYQIFSKMTQLFQRAILRMRAFRRSLRVDEELFYKQSLLFKPEQKEFASSVKELEARHFAFFAWHIRREQERLGKKNQFLEAVRLVELDLEEKEKEYLFVDRNGKPLTHSDKQEAFALLVLKALTASLDVHSSFLSPQEAETLRMKLEKSYEGVGIDIKEEGRFFVVKEVIPGSSAAVSGRIRPGDELLAIDDKKVMSMSRSQVLEALQGPIGSSVTLDMRRNGRLFRVHLERLKVAIEEGRVDAFAEKVSGGIIGIIQLHSFYQGQGTISSEEDVKEAIERLSKEGKIKALILDLRDNRGGFLIQAVKVVGLFIKTGVVVVARYADGSLHYFRDLDPSVIYAGPLIVLVSRETASAAEIVAQALQDYGIAIIVGDDHTYGKGSVQMQTVTEEDQKEPAFKVTIGQYYGVSGESVQGIGVKSDIVVPANLVPANLATSISERVGEKNMIAPSFQDPLTDVPAEKRAWFQENYIPFLQKKNEQFRRQIPELAKKSAERIAKNENYQRLLRGSNEVVEKKEGEQIQKTLTPHEAHKMLSDLQLQEAVNIAKEVQ